MVRRPVLKFTTPSLCLQINSSEAFWPLRSSSKSFSLVEVNLAIKAWSFTLCCSGTERRPAHRINPTADGAAVPPISGSYLPTSENSTPVQVHLFFNYTYLYIPKGAGEQKMIMFWLSEKCTSAAATLQDQPFVPDHKQRQPWWRLAFPWKIRTTRILLYLPMRFPGWLLASAAATGCLHFCRIA